MNLLRKFFVSCGAAVALCLAGCATLDGGSGQQQAGPDASKPGDVSPRVNSEMLRVGELVSIEFLEINQKIEQMVQEDGNLTLILGQTVKAAGKKTSELQADIIALYVPKYFRRMSVNIKRDNRYYWVDGSVKNPSQRPYTGEMTVLRAIAAAGGFNEYANRKKVEVLRANGKIEHVDALKALKNSKLDLPIYPGDTVHVREDWK